MMCWYGSTVILGFAGVKVAVRCKLTTENKIAFNAISFFGGGGSAAKGGSAGTGSIVSTDGLHT